MKNNVHVLFWLYKSKVNSKNQAPIYLRITIEGKKAQVSTGHQIDPAKWDAKRNKVKGSSQEAVRINASLLATESQLHHSVQELSQCTSLITPQKIIARWRGEDEDHKSLMELFDFKLGRIAETRKESTYNKFCTIKNRLERFLKKKYNSQDILLKELDERFITNFEYFAKVEDEEKYRLKQITVNKEIQRLKGVLDIAVRYSWLMKNPFFGYIPERAKTTKVFLNREELSALEKKEFELERLVLIRDFFIFSCYTGLGYAEAATITTSNITLDMDGHKWIESSREKTEKFFKVPLLPKAEQLIKKYETHPLALSKGTLLPVYSNQKVNSYLKEIADVCGIAKNLTHHVARKTFATTVLLNSGVPMDIVSKALGHSSIQITQNYYAELLDSTMMPHFSKLREAQLDEEKAQAKSVVNI